MISATVLAELGRALRARDAAHAGIDQSRERAERRRIGAFFTPMPLVELIVDNVLSRRFESGGVTWRDDGVPDLVVLDPAAGDGRFLISAIDWLVDRAARRGYQSDRLRPAITAHCVVAIERDEDFARILRERLPQATIHCVEALLGAPAALVADVVIGNPPYVRSIHLGQTDAELRNALRGRYAATSHGEWDLYAAFIEQALDWVREDGEVGLVVPSRWMTAQYAARLRGKLAAQSCVRGVIDFGCEQVFDGATTYASVLFLSRAKRVQLDVARLDGSVWRCGTIDSRSLNSAPWSLSVGSRRELVDRMADAGPSLGTIARIAKGAGTNADRVYVVEEVETGRYLSKETGEIHALEPQLLRPVLRGRDVKPFGTVSGKLWCLVPYLRDGTLVGPDDIGNLPHTAAYLERCRSRLAVRESGRFAADPAFYRWGRPQNMALLGDFAPKVVVPDIARRGRALIDGSGAMVLDSAYVLRSDDVPLELLTAVLSSRAVELWLRETGIPLRGGYMRMKTRYLESLPIPVASEFATTAADLATELAMRDKVNDQDLAELDELVRAAYQVPRKLWGAVV